MNKTECLVHQFLESQRKARHQPAHDSHPDHRHHDHSYHPEGAAGLRHTAHGSNLEQITEQNGSTHRKGRCEVLDVPSSETSDAGQVDEKEWQNRIVKSTSEPDVQRAIDREELQSRLLSKKQLSEMAWGVRELSRRLGSMRLKFRVRTVFILVKIHDQELIPKTREVARWLLDKSRDVRYTVYVQRPLKENKKFDAAGLLEEVRKDYVDSGEVTEEASHDIHRRLKYWDESMCRSRPHTFDFVITLGGDGTVLYASWLFQRIVPPVLSFALGSLGFLTKFDFEDYEKILAYAFSEGVTVSLRLRFEGTIMRSQKKHRKLLTDGADGERTSTSPDEDEEELHRRRDLVEELIGEEKEDEHTHRPDGTYEILNEIVVDRGPNASKNSPSHPLSLFRYPSYADLLRQAMSYAEIFGDDEHFTSVLADGVCVSTPTGSTAYNLAAGGSLCHPENPVMLVTSICAHTLSFRPIILPDTIVLRIGVPYDARTSSWASFDGRERVEMHPGDYVTISASRYPFATVQAQGRRSEDWVNSISGKLGWNTRQKQKAYKEWEK